LTLASAGRVSLELEARSALVILGEVEPYTGIDKNLKHAVGLLDPLEECRPQSRGGAARSFSAIACSPRGEERRGEESTIRCNETPFMRGVRYKLLQQLLHALWAR
jgi:hypothetical protein